MNSMIYITFLEREGPYVKIWGQTDKEVPIVIEKALKLITPQFEQGHCMMSPEFYQQGSMCCAKFKDGCYYRARIVNTLYINQGMVEVIFIDYGNRDTVAVNNLRTMTRFSCSLISTPAQAQEFILAGVMHPGVMWEDRVFDMISNEIKYLDLEYQEIGQIGNFILIHLSHGVQDISNSLLVRGLVSPVPIPVQQVVLQNMLVKPVNISRSMPTEMMVYPKQRSPGFVPQQGIRSPNIYSEPTLLTYKSQPLEFGSEHTVYVSYVTDGPCLFSVQQQNLEDRLKQLMMEINSIPLQQLDESPLPGCVCLARSTEDEYICRAVVTSMVDGNFKVFYVDFGNTEELPYTKLYQIPFKYVIPKVMATRFALEGLSNSVVSLDMKCAFKDFVNNKILFMRVKTPMPGTGLPLCDLWDENGQKAIDFVKCVALQSYPDPVPLARGFNQEIKVSFVCGCKSFFVQLKTKEDDLNNLMQKLQEVCVGSVQMDPEMLQEGVPCNALYTGDGMYYRAQVMNKEGGNQVHLRYIDYGNVEMVELHNIKLPEVDLITVLRPQAIECCLNGYQNMEPDEERDNIFEELILEQDFSMKVVEIQSSKMLVDLIDKDHYNVASLLLEKIAVKRSQVSPALVQDTSTIEIRKRTPPCNTRRSPREDSDRRPPNGKYESSWRDKPPRRQADDGKEWRDKPNRNDYEPREERQYKKFDSNKNTKHERNGDSSWGNNDFQSSDRHTNTNRKPRNDESSWGGNNDFKSDFKQKPRNDESNWGNNDFNSETNKRKSRNDFHNNTDFNRNKKSDGSEKSWSGSEKSQPRFRDRPERTERKPARSYNQKSDQYGASNHKTNSWQNKDEPEEVLDYALSESKFGTVEQVDKCENISISWFYNPTNFYCQLESSKGDFSKMMREVQTSYRKRKPFEAPIGCPVVALFAEDNALYRGTVLEKEMSTYKVLYVDFGNVASAKCVFQIEKKHMEMPLQAYRCSLDGISPVGDAWPAPDSFSSYFEKDLFECTFIYLEEDKYNVILSHNGNSVKDLLIRDGLAVEQITAATELDSFNVDYLMGQTIRCQLASVNKLSDILLQFRPAVFLHCGLHNLDKAAPQGETKLQKFLGQNIIAYVNNVVNHRLDVTLYDNSGYVLDIVELDDTNMEAVCPILQTPVLSTNLSGLVSHVTEDSIFIQLSQYAEDVNVLLDELFAHYEHSEANINEATVGGAYAVWSEDGNCYRGIVKSIDESGSVSVFYVDYGNCEDVAVTSLRNLEEKHYEPHRLAIELAQEGDESMLQQEINLSIAVRWFNDKWVPVTEGEEQPAEVATIEEQPASMGFSVFLSHSDNPGQFYLQLSEAVDTIDELQEQLNIEAPNLPDIETVTTGILCAAPYSVDQMWYRAQVLDGDTDITTVRFVDYGNTDVLDNTASKVKTLPPELLSIEHHAKRCSLYLASLEQEWSTECCERFELLTTDKNLTAEVIHQDEKTTFIDLYVDGLNIAKILTEEKLAKELQMEISPSCTGFVSHLNSPSEFWIQLESACNDLEWIADQLTNAENYTQLEDQAPGCLCAAVFPDDANWYRARILSNTVAGVEVLFVDYGNSCTCTSLRELPEDLVMLPPLAQKCSLQKPPGLLQWSQSATDTFGEISADGITIFTVNMLSQGETSVVQLLHEGVDISGRLLPETFDGEISAFKSIHSFSVKNVETGDVMDNCRMECLPGHVWNDQSEEDFEAVYNKGDNTYKVEVVTDTSVRLYLNGSDVRSEISMVKSTPSSSVQSTPKKNSEPTKETDVQLADLIEEPEVFEEEEVAVVEVLKAEIEDLPIEKIQSEELIGAGNDSDDASVIICSEENESDAKNISAEILVLAIETDASEDKTGTGNETDASEDKTGTGNNTDASEDKTGTGNNTDASEDNTGTGNNTDASEDKTGTGNNTDASEDKTGTGNNTDASEDKTNEGNETDASVDKTGTGKETDASEDKSGTGNETDMSEDKTGTGNETDSSVNTSCEEHIVESDASAKSSGEGEKFTDAEMNDDSSADSGNNSSDTSGASEPLSTADVNKTSDLCSTVTDEEIIGDLEEPENVPKSSDAEKEDKGSLSEKKQKTEENKSCVTGQEEKLRITGEEAQLRITVEKEKLRIIGEVEELRLSDEGKKRAEQDKSCISGDKITDSKVGANETKVDSKLSKKAVCDAEGPTEIVAVDLNSSNASDGSVDSETTESELKSESSDGYSTTKEEDSDEEGGPLQAN